MTPEKFDIARTANALMKVILLCVQDCEISTNVVGKPNPRVKRIWDICQERAEESYAAFPLTPEEIGEARKKPSISHEL